MREYFSNCVHMIFIFFRYDIAKLTRAEPHRSVSNTPPQATPHLGNDRVYLGHFLFLPEKGTGSIWTAAE